jgi:serine/threonine-protein kinase
MTMRADKKKLECNSWLLSRYLEQELTAKQEAELEAHLDGCPTCRQQMSDSAAEADWWTGASRYLKADVWDEKASHSATGMLASTVSNKDPRSDELVIRQLTEWLDPTDDPQFIGRFGGYEILGVIGHGGMGVVLKGFERSLNRYVAIKVLAPSLATSGAARKRFAREAQAAAAVLHENVIAIHRVADSHDLPYLVMSYVGGISLQKRIDEEGPLPLVAILRISHQIATGLAAAHSQGLVHRDIKPANILLERGVERVTITDFGLARATDDGSLTKTGFIAGTPQYMSPEQARGESIDARSDLFSLGSVIYAMCTGHPPFRAETSYGILRRITDGQPRPIREINSNVPEWFAPIVERLHAKSPRERIQSADELADLLEQCLAHVQQPSVSPLPPSLRETVSGSRGVWRAFLSVAAVLAAAFLGAGLFSREESESPDADRMAVAASPESTNSRRESSGAAHWQDGASQQLRQFGDELPQFEKRAARPWDSVRSAKFPQMRRFSNR